MIINIIEYSTVLFAMVGNLQYIPEEQKKLVITMCLSGMRTIGIENAAGIKKKKKKDLALFDGSPMGEVVKHPLDKVWSLWQPIF